jgi:hypothetical protein
VKEFKSQGGTTLGLFHFNAVTVNEILLSIFTRLRSNLKREVSYLLDPMLDHIQNYCSRSRNGPRGGSMSLRLGPGSNRVLYPYNG